MREKFYLYLEVNFAFVMHRFSRNSQFLDSICLSTIPNFTQIDQRVRTLLNYVLMYCTIRLD